ncbi:MAG: class I SAM-dependent methyltransferase [Rhizobiaceae bacterium]
MPAEQTWEPESYQRDTGFVSVFGEDVLHWLAPLKDERILDIGCGDGALTRKLVDIAARVVGIDASASFVQSARQAGLDVHLMDAQELTFESEFDAVFTNAALHWMLQPEKVIAGVGRALKPGGRFVGEFGGFGNVAAILTAIQAVGHELGGDAKLAGPWFFPTVSQYSKLLEAGGFEVVDMSHFYRQTQLPTGIRAWLKVMCNPFFEQFEDRSELVLDKVEQALKPSLCDNEGNWFADYVRLRFSARLQA